MRSPPPAHRRDGREMLGMPRRERPGPVAAHAQSRHVDPLGIHVHLGFQAMQQAQQRLVVPNFPFRALGRGEDERELPPLPHQFRRAVDRDLRKVRAALARAMEEQHQRPLFRRVGVIVLRHVEKVLVRVGLGDHLGKGLRCLRAGPGNDAMDARSGPGATGQKRQCQCRDDGDRGFHARRMRRTFAARQAWICARNHGPERAIQEFTGGNAGHGDGDWNRWRDGTRSETQCFEKSDTRMPRSNRPNPCSIHFTTEITEITECKPPWFPDR